MRGFIKFIYKKIKNNKKGFTLLEALITTAIVAIASSMSISVFLVNSRANGLQAEINDQQNLALREAERNLAKENPEMYYRYDTDMRLPMYESNPKNDIGELMGEGNNHRILITAGKTGEIDGVRYKYFKTRMKPEENPVEDSSDSDEVIDFTEATTTTEATTESTTEATTESVSTETTMESSTEATTEATTETTTYGRNPLEEIGSDKIESGIKNNVYPTPEKAYSGWEEYYKERMAESYPDLAKKDNWDELWDKYWSKNGSTYIDALKDIHGENYSKYWSELDKYKTSAKGDTTEWSKYWLTNFQKKEAEG